MWGCCTGAVKGLELLDSITWQFPTSHSSTPHSSRPHGSACGTQASGALPVQRGWRVEDGISPFCSVRKNLMFLVYSLYDYRLVEGKLGENLDFLLFVSFVEVSQEIRKQLRMGMGQWGYFYNNEHFAVIYGMYLWWLETLQPSWLENVSLILSRIMLIWKLEYCYWTRGQRGIR